MEVDVHGHLGLVLADDLDDPAPEEPWLALLPSLDPTPMGWKQREWYLGGLEAELFDRNGNTVIKPSFPTPLQTRLSA